MNLQWLVPEEDILCLWRRLYEDGYAVDRFQEACTRAARTGDRLAALKQMEEMEKMPLKKDRQWEEPSDYEAIRRLSTPMEKIQVTLPYEVQKDRVKGAWTGRISGCLLGKPVECMCRSDIHEIQQQTGNLPLRGYLRVPDLSKVHPQGSFVNVEMDALSKSCWLENIRGFSPWDDDTNYTVLSLKLVQEYGMGFTPEDVLMCWLKWLPAISTCTAERIAYKNAMNGLLPPDTATYRNPFSHMVGAQIRADFYGYIHPGDPLRAAEMAWRDASVSHTGNGIYGAMFAAAMTAVAAVSDNREEILQAGLSVVTPKSRLFRDVTDVIELWSSGSSWEHTVNMIHERYDEHSFYDWCSVLPNAMIVTAALLYGEGDFGRSMCLAVEAAFDTDCNAATVGSLVGMSTGFSQIPASWYDPFEETLQTTMPGLGMVKIEELATQTMALMSEKA